MKQFLKFSNLIKNLHETNQRMGLLVFDLDKVVSLKIFDIRAIIVELCFIISYDSYASCKYFINSGSGQRNVYKLYIGSFY